MTHAETTIKSKYLQLLRKTVAEKYGQPETSAEMWIKNHVLKAEREGMFSCVFRIGPEHARALLRHNIGNRNINEHHVVRIAHDIDNGLWKLNGEPIIVADDGSLNDGQHRLHACIISDKPIDTLVVFGAERETRFTVDMGRQRTAGNFLAMKDVVNSNSLAAIAKLLMIYSRRAYTNADYVSGTKQEVIRFYSENREKIDSAFSAVYSNKFARSIGASPITAAYVILFDLNPSACEDFFNALLEGEGLHRGSAILQARAHLIEAKTSRIYAWEKMEIIFRYWNAWRLQKDVRRNIPLRREWPLLEP